MGTIAMVKCLNCGNEFPHSDLLDKAYLKQPECCSQCSSKKFSFFNISTPDIQSNYKKHNSQSYNKNKKHYSNQRQNNNYPKQNKEVNYDYDLSLLEEERRNRELEIEEEIYRQEIQRQYDFEEENHYNHQKATYDYIMNDYNNNGIPDHKE